MNCFHLQEEKGCWCAFSVNLFMTPYEHVPECGDIRINKPFSLYDFFILGLRLGNLCFDKCSYCKPIRPNNLLYHNKLFRREVAGGMVTKEDNGTQSKGVKKLKGFHLRFDLDSPC